MMVRWWANLMALTWSDLKVQIRPNGKSNLKLKHTQRQQFETEAKESGSNFLEQRLLAFKRPKGINYIQLLKAFN